MDGDFVGPTRFLQRKAKAVAELGLPEASYTDASPKGSVDRGVRELISEINSHPGLVTTSSCAGRVSVFLEGQKTAPAELQSEARSEAQLKLAGEVGGKGGGGHWLYVSHETFDSPQQHPWAPLLFGDAQLAAPTEMDVGLEEVPGPDPLRLIHFKFEPMILHILAASPEYAQSVIRCGLEAGFRESGAINLTAAQGQATPLVAIRSMGLGFESIIGTHFGGENRCIVSEDYLAMLVRMTNQRFAQNSKRTERFRQALAALKERAGGRPAKPGWEDAAARRARKKEEGLKRKSELGQHGRRQQSAPDDASGPEPEIQA